MRYINKTAAADTHSPRGSVDCNIRAAWRYLNISRHSPRGSVDWNKKILNKPEKEIVTPLVGVWIEIISLCQSLPNNRVTPLVGVWIEMQEQEENYGLQRSLPSWECGLKYQKRKTPIRVSMSLPSWECGLKLVFPYAQETLEFVYALAMVRLHTKKWECRKRQTSANRKLQLKWLSPNPQ